MSRPGHVFIRWTTDGSATLDVIRPGETVTLGAEDLTLYARWVRLNTVSVDGATFPTGTDDVAAFAFANWLTEMTIGASHVFYDLSNLSGDISATATADMCKTGYPVPTVDERELVARKR